MISRLFRKGWRRVLLGLGLIVLLAGAALAIAVPLLNPRLTRYIEGPAFLAEMNKQTAKGLHFPAGAAHYAPLRRSGFFTIASDGFDAERGEKALRAIHARGITARFNPLGVFLRRWQLDEVRIASGTVEIQIYEPKPEVKPPKPWYHIFLPDRVYLRRIEAKPVDVTWRMQGKPGGIFGTQLVITPHGRDFDYAAIGGTMRNPMMPDLPLRDTHLLITKTLFTLYNLDLMPRAEDGGQPGAIHAEGRMGTREDKRVDFQLTFARVPVANWLPASWRNHTRGSASGHLAWRGKNPQLASAEVDAAVQIANGEVRGLPALKKLATLTGKGALETLRLDECQARLTLAAGRGKVSEIAVEDGGKLRLEGAVTLEQEKLGGQLRLGAVPELLTWLPKDQTIFTAGPGDYRWAAIPLSGTLKQPRQDLSARITDAVKSSPGSAAGVFFREVGAWFGGE